jgi:hypothetical protein
MTVRKLTNIPSGRDAFTLHYVPHASRDAGRQTESRRLLRTGLFASPSPQSRSVILWHCWTSHCTRGQPGTYVEP